jgi:endonuclease YncB( thermonuclease family)
MTFGRILFAAACLLSFPAFADDLIGQASIIDGDTLEIHGTRIRLWGVDAPESSQLCRGEDSLQYRCGAKAANELDAFIARRPVDCSPISLDQYRRTVVNATLSMRGEGFGRAATLSRGYSAHVLSKAGCRATVRTMQTRILNPDT